MNAKVIKTTSKGQITIPKKWRNEKNTDNFLLEVHDQKIVIKPLYLEKEEVVFDADRDNNGKGISAQEMLNLLKEAKNG